MNIQKEIKLLVLPLVKSAPVIALLIVVAILGMKRVVNVMTPAYQSDGAIKINNLEYAQAGFMLFGKEEGSMHQQNQSFLTELEVFRSRDLIETTLSALNWELSVYREGRFRLAELGAESPFEVSYSRLSEKAYDQELVLEYVGEAGFKLSSPDVAGLSLPLAWDTTVIAGDWQLKLHKKADWLAEKPESLLPGHRFHLRLHTLEELTKGVNESNLFVKAVEKDISIIKIYFKHERPEKARDFVNQLMYQYISTCRTHKEEQADTTLAYLQQELQQLGEELSDAEGELAYFRTQAGLVDAKLEADTRLRGLTQLDEQQMQLQLEKGELDQLFRFLREGHDLADFSPNFSALSDPIFRDAFLQVQQLELQRQDLVAKYVPSSEPVQRLDRKMKDLRTFLNESVRQTIDNLDYQQRELRGAASLADAALMELPDKERQLLRLQRMVSLKEAMYNYLMRKGTELAISRSSNLYPHKIIDHAQLPEGLSAPNKPLLYGLAFLLALMAGMAFAYTRHYFIARVRYAEDLVEKLGVQVMAQVYRTTKARPWWNPIKQASTATDSYGVCSNLVANLHQWRAAQPHRPDGKGRVLSFSSMAPGEGKTFVSLQLAQSLAQVGYRVLLVDANLRRPQLHQLLGLNNAAGMADLLQKKPYAIQATEQPGLHVLPAGDIQGFSFALFYGEPPRMALERWREDFDFVILDTPPIGLFQDLISLMQAVDLNLFVLRADFSRTRLLRATRKQLEELQSLPLALVLNDTLQARSLPGYQSLLKRYFNW